MVKKESEKYKKVGEIYANQVHLLRDYGLRHRIVTYLFAFITILNGLIILMWSTWRLVNELFYLPTDVTLLKIGTPVWLFLGLFSVFFITLMVKRTRRARISAQCEKVILANPDLFSLVRKQTEKILDINTSE